MADTFAVPALAAPAQQERETAGHRGLGRANGLRL